MKSKDYVQADTQVRVAAELTLTHSSIGLTTGCEAAEDYGFHRTVFRPHALEPTFLSQVQREVDPN